jgi:hypothetical protein
VRRARVSNDELGGENQCAGVAGSLRRFLQRRRWGFLKAVAMTQSRGSGAGVRRLWSAGRLARAARKAGRRTGGQARGDS